MGLDLSCDWKAGFVMDPMKKQRVGYLLDFKGLGMTDRLAADLKVFTPYTHSAAPNYSAAKVAEDGTITCVGIVENFSFGGGVGDPLCLSVYISAENANVLQAKLKTTLSTNTVTSMAWWICNFDEENKAWFEESHPMGDKNEGKIKGQINAPGGKDLRIAVAQEASKVASNIDVNVYNMYVEIIPAADDTYAFNFATSSKTKYVRNWGLKVGTYAEQATK